MPLPKERLDKIKEILEEGARNYKDLQEVVSDLEAAGRPVTRQREELAKLHEEHRVLKLFYDLEMKRLKTPEE